MKEKLFVNQERVESTTKEIYLGEPTVWGDHQKIEILDSKNNLIGEIVITLNDETKNAVLGNIFIDEKNRGGLGTTLYKMIADKLGQKGYSLVSSRVNSQAAQRVWKKLLEEDIAIEENGRYIIKN
jgi:hypothetical protein